MGIKHNKVATLPDEAGAEVNKTEWNEDHTIDGDVDFNGHDVIDVGLVDGYDVSVLGDKLAGLPDAAIQDVGDEGTTSGTPRGRINFTGAAVVSDNAGTNSKDVDIAGYAIGPVDAANLSAPADSTTYFFGSSGAAPTTSAGLNRIYFDKAGTVKKARISIRNGGTLGSAETSTVSFRLNDTTDTTVSSAVTTNATFQSFVSGTLAIAVAAGDYFEFKWVTPAWATNPTNLIVIIQIYVE